MERFFDFISRTGDGVFVVDADQRVVLWNDAAGRLLGHRHEQAVGRACHELLGGTDERSCAFCRRDCIAFRAASRGEIVPTRELRVRTRSGRRIWVSVTTILLTSVRHGLPVLAHVFRDVERRKETERDHAQLLARLAGASADGSRPGAAAVDPEPLTPREGEVLGLLTSGRSTESIAESLGIGVPTVRTHVQRVLRKLGAHSRLEAVTLALRFRLP